MMKLLVINGPNLNLLGVREPSIYGKQDYPALLSYMQEICEKEQIEVCFFQSNHEGAIVDEIQSALNTQDAILINPAAYTHTSVAILDALKAVALPTVEVHLSDINSREAFRQHSYISAAALKTIAGKGFEGYKEGILFLKEYLLNQK